jgi:hypothetical protein
VLEPDLKTNQGRSLSQREDLLQVSSASALEAQEQASAKQVLQVLALALPVLALRRASRALALRRASRVPVSQARQELRGKMAYLEFPESQMHV